MVGRKPLNKNEQGFSLIEILIVLVSVGILVAIVANTYAGIKKRSRDNIRTADIKLIQENIEAFYSQNMYYPSLKDLNNATWRKDNLKNLAASSLRDPSWTNTDKACTIGGTWVLLDKSQHGCFGYAPTNNGVSCESSDTSCNEYTLTASLEQGGLYEKTQLD